MRKRKIKVTLLGYQWVQRPLTDYFEETKTITISPNNEMITKGKWFEEMKKGIKVS